MYRRAVEVCTYWEGEETRRQRDQCVATGIRIGNRRSCQSVHQGARVTRCVGADERARARTHTHARTHAYTHTHTHRSTLRFEEPLLAQYRAAAIVNRVGVSGKRLVPAVMHTPTPSTLNLTLTNARRGCQSSVMSQRPPAFRPPAQAGSAQWRGLEGTVTVTESPGHQPAPRSPAPRTGHHPATTMQ